MKKIKMFALFIMMLLCVTLLSACYEATPNFDEPFCELSDSNNSFHMVCSAYKSQKEAKDNPITVYTDALIGEESSHKYVKGVICTKGGWFDEEKWYVYGSFLLYKTHDEDSAYVYIDVKPLSEKPSDSCTVEQQENTEQEEKSSSDVSDLEETKNNNNIEDTEQQEDEEKIPSLEMSEEIDSENSNASDSEEIDFSPVYEKLDGIIDKEIIQKDLTDFVKGEWDGSVRLENNAWRHLYVGNRSYIVSVSDSKSIKDSEVNIDYSGELKKFPGSQYTLVVDGNNIEEWKYFKQVNRWNIEEIQEIISVEALSYEGVGYVIAKDIEGNRHGHKLCADGTVVKN